MPGDDQVQNNFSMETAPIQQPDITPVANPTAIRFITPAQSEIAAPMKALAQSLQSMDAGLGSFLDAREKQQAAADAIKGNADFYKNNKVGDVAATQQGLQPANNSPAYVAAWKNAQGTVAGQDLQQKFDAAYDAWPGKNTPGADFSSFSQSFIKQNVSSDDPQVLKGLLPVVHSMIDSGHSRFIQDQHTLAVNGSVDTHIALVDNAINAMQQDALQSGKPIDTTKGGGFINSIRDSYLQSGGTPAQFDQKFIDTITSKALQAGGANGAAILSLLDQNVPGTDHTYAQTNYGLGSKLNTTNQLQAQDKRAIAEGKAKTDEANTAALGDVTSRTLNSIAANPGQPIPDALLAEGTKYDPQFRVHAAGWADTLLKNSGTSDPDAILQMNVRIANGDPNAISDAMTHGVIHSPEEFKEALKFQEQTKTVQSKMAPVLNSEPVKTLLGQVKDIVAAKDPLGHIIDGTLGAQRYLALQYSFQRQMSDWVAANPNATEEQQQEKVAQIGGALIKGIKAEGGTVQSVDIPPTSSPNPYAPQAAPPAPQPQAPAQQAPAAPTAAPAGQQQQGQAATPPDPQAVAAWVQSLPPTQQQQIAEAAQKHGDDPAVAAVKFYQAAMAKQQAAQPPVAPPAPAPAPNHSATVGPQTDLQKQVGDALHAWKEGDPNTPQLIHQLAAAFTGAMHSTGAPIGNYTVAAIKDNPKAAHILDFISGPESHGNYNAYFQNAGSTKDLSGMSINQILQWQKARTDGGSQSSATGRYQFMRDTLNALKTQMGLTGNEKFTPEMQDNLALQLLKNRGFDKWQKGSLSDAQFANNLSEEWASLPDVHTGRSHYAGDGLNKSLVTPQQVLATLDGAKAKPGATTGLQASKPSVAPAMDDYNESKNSK